MGSFLRKLRGILRTGLTWAGAWSIAGTLLQAGLHILGIARAPDLAVAPLMWGVMGFYGGSAFGALLSLTEGRKTLEKLRIGRVAIWGLVAGLAIPVLYELLRGDLQALSLVTFSMEALIVGPLSAVSAAGMTAIAKSASAGRLESEEEPVALPGLGGAVSRGEQNG